MAARRNPSVLELDSEIMGAPIRVYVTANHEYHFRHEVCVGVRSRATAGWVACHRALGRPLATSSVDEHGRPCTFALPRLGEPLCFLIDGVIETTSPLLGIERTMDMPRPTRAPRVDPVTAVDERRRLGDLKEARRRG